MANHTQIEKLVRQERILKYTPAFMIDKFVWILIKCDRNYDMKKFNSEGKLKEDTIEIYDSINCPQYVWNKVRLGKVRLRSVMLCYVMLCYVRLG